VTRCAAAAALGASLLLGAAGGCTPAQDTEDPTTTTAGLTTTLSTSGGSESTGSDASSTASASAGTTTGTRFDFGDASGGAGTTCGEGGSCGTCNVPAHTPCDGSTGSAFEAMGVGCPGEWSVLASSSIAASNVGVIGAFGSGGAFPPREGSRYAVIGTGPISELANVTPPGDGNDLPTYCNVETGGAQYDLGNTLPLPIRVNNVGGDCTLDVSLVGTGDCSNTIQAQFNQGVGGFGSTGVNDYGELRITVTVPPTVTSLSYDFAFFSTEYPFYFGQQYNDMYIGWLESESWTGNISFDERSNPISLNAGFLDYRDDPRGSAPELAGTCMVQHAGTKWLTTTAPVTPGETVVLVFAVFDLADGALDSFVLLDNFQWGCEGGTVPDTKPVG
jgi:hypothetical protein